MKAGLSLTLNYVTTSANIDMHRDFVQFVYDNFGADGIPGDEATAAILVNHLAGVDAAPDGLRTVLEVPVPRVAR